MNFWDFLATPNGTELIHFAILAVNLIVLASSHRTRKKTDLVQRRLDIYVKRLMDDIHGGHSHD